MKSNNKKKSLFRLLKASLLMTCTTIICSSAFANTMTNLLDSPEIVSTSPETGITIPREQPKIPLDYVNQPPMIPHNIDTYQVNKNTNRCLDCHSVKSSRKAGATRISATHFMDMEGNTLANVAPRRYFCLQCHVPQTTADPIVDNEFKPLAGFGQ